MYNVIKFSNGESRRLIRNIYTDGNVRAFNVINYTYLGVKCMSIIRHETLGGLSVC